MRIGNNGGRVVLVEGQRALDVESASGGGFGPDPQSVYGRWTEFRAWASERPDGPWAPLEAGRLGPPAPRPRQVFAVALNYGDHAEEAKLEVPAHPSIFTKFPSCIAGPNDDIRLPTDRADSEVELVAVIGPEARRVAENEAWEHVAGLTVGQDVSERRIQFRPPNPQFSLGKSLPTFGPTGPVLVTPDELATPDDLEICCSVNGREMQRSRTSNLIFSVPKLVSELSSLLPLLPGDLIFTGTPSGVGSSRDPRVYLKDGDVVVSEIAGIGRMTNHCRAE